MWRTKGGGLKFLLRDYNTRPQLQQYMIRIFLMQVHICLFFQLYIYDYPICCSVILYSTGGLFAPVFEWYEHSKELRVSQSVVSVESLSLIHHRFYPRFVRYLC